MKNKLIIILLIASFLGNGYFLIDQRSQAEKQDMLWENEFNQFMLDLIPYKENLENNEVLEVYHKSFERQAAKLIYFSKSDREELSDQMLAFVKILDEIDLTNENNSNKLIFTIENIIMTHNNLNSKLLAKEISFEMFLENLNDAFLDGTQLLLKSE